MKRAALPDISIRQLEYLVAVADAPTWAAAATSVGVSPSALSQGLAELERRVGVDLFEPDGRRRVLRTSARPVLDHARQVVTLTADLLAWSTRLQTARSGTVRLGLIDVAAVRHFPEVLRAFRFDHPAVELTLTVAPSSALLASLQAGELDLVVCVEPPDPPTGIEASGVLHEPLVIYTPADVTVGAPSTWGPWVLFPADSHTRAAVAERLTELGAPIRVSAESHQPDVLLEMVSLGLGWTVLPRVADEVLPTHVAAGDELLTRNLVLARRANSIHDPVVDELAEQLGGV